MYRPSRRLAADNSNTTTFLPPLLPPHHGSRLRHCTGTLKPGQTRKPNSPQDLANLQTLHPKYSLAKRQNPPCLFCSLGHYGTRHKVHSCSCRQTDSLASVQILLQGLEFLTLVRVDRGSREKVLREGHIPDIHSPLSFVIVLMKSWRVHHSCVIWTTCCLSTTNHVNPALQIIYKPYIAHMHVKATSHSMHINSTLHIMHVNPTLHTMRVNPTFDSCEHHTVVRNPVHEMLLTVFWV